MSNYTSENLINVKPSQVPAGTLAVKIGEDVFTAGSVTVGEEVTAGYFAKDGDDLKFYPVGSQTGEVVSEVMIADTGKEEPQYEGGSGGSSMNFYKCASVDTSNSTWSGHLASISDSTGIWYFSSDSTSLIFDRLTPVVGSVYDEECSFQVTQYKTLLPEQGLVFYAPLKSAQSTTETGQAINVHGSFAYQTFYNVPCVHLPSGAWINSSLPSAPTLSAFTMTAWRYAVNGTTYGYHYGVVTEQWNKKLMLDNTVLYYDSGQYISNMTGTDGTWYFEVVMWDGSTLNVYRNSSIFGSGDISSGVIVGTDVVMGAATATGSENSNDIYMSSLRIYNRALSASEISALASEFTPTAS